MLKFSRPKGPGFGISGGFYLSVLSSQASLPSIVQVINPTGEGNAVTGFGVPMAAYATKASLSTPMERGAYGLATKDRKTVIRMLVISKEEAGFDTGQVAHNARALGIEGELLARIKATWTILQLRFESHDPTVYPALDFILALVLKLGALTDGAIADPVSQRYLLPEQVFARPRVNALVDAREHVAVHYRGTPSGVSAYTKGLEKFALHEMEIPNLFPDSELAAEKFLLNASQRILEGHPVQSGNRLGKFEVREGGFDRTLWNGIPCFELLPQPGLSASEALES